MKYHQTILTYVAAISLFGSLSAFASSDQNRSPVKEAILRNIIETTTIESEEIRDENVLKCFSKPMFLAKVTNRGMNLNGRNRIYFKDEGKAIQILEDDTDEGRVSSLSSIVSPEFKLKTGEDGEIFSKAMRTLYPQYIKDDFETRLTQVGNKWYWIHDTYLEDFLGFAIETDSDGKITKVIHNQIIKAETLK